MCNSNSFRRNHQGEGKGKRGRKRENDYILILLIIKEPVTPPKLNNIKNPLKEIFLSRIRGKGNLHVVSMIEGRLLILHHLHYGTLKVPVRYLFYRSWSRKTRKRLVKETSFGRWYNSYEFVRIPLDGEWMIGTFTLHLRLDWGQFESPLTSGPSVELELETLSGTQSCHPHPDRKGTFVPVHLRAFSPHRTLFSNDERRVITNFLCHSVWRENLYLRTPSIIRTHMTQPIRWFT